MSIRRPRVIHVVHSLNLGGAERLAARLAVTLSDEFDIAVACLDAAGLWAREVREAGVTVVELYRQPGIDLMVPLRLSQLARAREVGLIHAHQYSPYFYSTLGRLLAPSTRLLFHEHGRHYPERESPRRIAVNRFVFRHLTSRVVAVSADVRDRLVRYEGLPKQLIEVVYNGTEASPPASQDERAAIRKSLGLTDDDLVLGTVGRLDPVKNVPLAIQALEALRPRYPSLKMLVVGDGPARAEIEAEAVTRGVRDAVIMTGFREDAAELVRAMDLFLLPSLTEGTSLALVGAMAAGVPCVATAVGGTPEVIEDGRTGRLIPSEDAGRLISAIQELLDAPDQAALLGSAGRAVYLERFTFAAMIDSFRRIYREELEGAR